MKEDEDGGLGKAGFGGWGPPEGPSKAGFLGSKKEEGEWEVEEEEEEQEEEELEDRVGCKGILRRPAWEGDPMLLSVWGPAVWAAWAAWAAWKRALMAFTSDSWRERVGSVSAQRGGSLPRSLTWRNTVTHE